jgi:hypothetical protein
VYAIRAHQDYERARQVGQEDAIFQAAKAAWQVSLLELNVLKREYMEARDEATLHGVPQQMIDDAVHDARVALDAAQAKHDELLAACEAARPLEGVFRLGRLTRFLARASLASSAILSASLTVNAYYVVIIFTMFRFMCADEVNWARVLLGVVGGVILFIPIALFHFAIFQSALQAP